MYLLGIDTTEKLLRQYCCPWATQFESSTCVSITPCCSSCTRSDHDVLFGILNPECTATTPAVRLVWDTNLKPANDMRSANSSCLEGSVRDKGMHRGRGWKRLHSSARVCSIRRTVELSSRDGRSLPWLPCFFSFQRSTWGFVMWHISYGV